MEVDQKGTEKKRETWIRWDDHETVESTAKRKGNDE
jgi:hypothetical protein